MTADAPVMLDHLSDAAKQHFDTVLAHLDALGVPYVINPRMVRGLDYYTKTTFEFVHDGLGAQSGIGGGGRYDGLMRQLGGQDLSGIGFGLGVDRTLLALRAEGVTVGPTSRVDVFGVPLGGAGQAGPGGAGRGNCAATVCGSISPTAIAGSRARCAPPTAPARLSRWWPVTATSRRAPSGSRSSRPVSSWISPRIRLSPRCFRDLPNRRRWGRSSRHLRAVARRGAGRCCRC